MPISDGVARAGVLALLAGCSPTGHSATADDGGMVLCAEGEGMLARSCTVERTQTARGLVLTLRHPDGSFQRLLATKDGRGLVAADGAAPARIVVVGSDLIEVALDHDRYRLSATVKR